MTTLVEQLSSYAAALRYEELPREVVHQAKRLIIDTMGCALGGYGSEPAQIARDLAGAVTSTQPATVILSGQRSSPDLATFANGVMIRFLDFNDGYTSSGESGHPSDSIAAVLAADGFHIGNGFFARQQTGAGNHRGKGVHEMQFRTLTYRGRQRLSERGRDVVTELPHVRRDSGVRRMHVSSSVSVERDDNTALDQQAHADGGPSLTPPVIAATLRIPDFARSGNEDHGDP